MSTDGKITVPPDSSGKNIDTTELTRVDGTVVEAQRIVLRDPTDLNSFAGVNSRGELAVTIQLNEIIDQLKRIALLLEIHTGQEVSVHDVS